MPEPVEDDQQPSAAVTVYKDGTSVGFWTRCAGCGDRIGKAINLPDGVKSKLDLLDQVPGALLGGLDPSDLEQMRFSFTLPGFTVYGSCCDG